MSNGNDDTIIGPLDSRDVVLFGTAGAGLYAGWRLFFHDEVESACRARLEQSRDDLRMVLENPNDLSDAELQETVSFYQATVETYNQHARENQRVDTGQVASDLRGQPLEEKAATWITMAQQVLLSCIEQRSSQSEIERMIERVIPDWLLQYWDMILSGIAITTIVVIIGRLTDWGRGGGGSALALLRDGTRSLIENGIYGSPNNPEQIDREPEAFEQPQPSPDPGFAIQGSPRGVSWEVGTAGDILLTVAEWLGIAIDETVGFGDEAITAIVESTSLSTQDVQQNPELLVAALIAAAAAVAVATGSTIPAIGVAAGLAIMVTLGELLGFSVDTDQILDAGEVALDDSTL